MFKRVLLQVVARVTVITLISWLIAAIFLLCSTFWPLWCTAGVILVIGTSVHFGTYVGMQSGLLGLDGKLLLLGSTMFSWFSLMCLSAPGLSAKDWLIRATVIAIYAIVIAAIDAAITTHYQSRPAHTPCQTE